ncbi:hypothetical protein EUX98_g1618 [Antrodiella citrinella]|uniref:Uncharacterized protein n=1 Tax=Antrodiella citrinella TaxID=2447956 RepID=A0A4S4N0Y8_9APHY|nr:hypothetical protein EUX98_g1618 [Antrodiella citrinella]
MNFLGMFFSACIYGIHVALFIACLRPVLKRGRWLGAYVAILFTLATTGIALQVYWHAVAFIDHRNDPGGPYEFLKQNVMHPVNIALTVIYLLLNWFSDGIVLYRFYVIYSVIGAHGVFTTIASVIMLLALVVTGSVFTPSIASLGSNLWTDISTAPGIAYLTLSLCINTVLTLLIVGRIIYIGRHLRQLGTLQNTQYTSIITLLVESAALYTFWALISVIACGVSSPVQFALLPALGQLQAIPPLLILTRVANGRALTRDTYSTVSTATKVRFSTNCVDTLPPYRTRSSFSSTSKVSPYLKPIDTTYSPLRSCRDLESARTMSPMMDTCTDTSSPIDTPPHAYFAM